MSEVGVHKLLNVQDVRLDKDNPRIKKFLEMYNRDPTPDEIHLALGAGGDETQAGGTTYASLKESIRTNGGIIHPIIVNETEDGVLTVIEGNTRVAIFRSFLDDGTIGEWNDIPAVVYRDLDPEHIDAIRLQAHLVGPRAWDPYSKAKYLHFLRSVEKIPFDRLVDYCGGRRAEVVSYIDAYTDMERFYRPIVTDDQFDTTRFSGYVELQKVGIKEAIAQAGFNLTDFSHWINDRLIDPLNTVRKLPRILKEKEIRDVFLQDGAREAIRLLDIPNLGELLTEATLEQICSALVRAIDALPFGDLRRLKEYPESSTTIALLDAYDALQDIQSEVAPD